MSSSVISAKGVLCSLLASALFGLMPWYVNQLQPLTGDLLLWSRIAFSAALLVPFLLWQRQGRALLALLRSPVTLLIMLICAAQNGLQWFLFVSAPVNGLTKELALTRLRFSDEVKAINEEMHEDPLARRDADCLLMGETLLSLQRELVSQLGGLA